jgi:hypothetical protein
LITRRVSDPTLPTQETNYRMTAAAIRSFSTGATRDTDDNKHDVHGYMSPIVRLRFAEYMTSKRRQPDGSVRSGSNWQNGMPRLEYAKSLERHVLDVALHVDGDGDRAKEPLEVALCAAIFNAVGLLHEVLRDRDVPA